MGATVGHELENKPVLPRLLRSRRMVPFRVDEE
jgi:hypothetical protein